MNHWDRSLMIALGAALSRVKRQRTAFSWNDAWGDDDKLLAAAAERLGMDLPAMKLECETDIAEMDAKFRAEAGLPPSAEKREITCTGCATAATCPYAYDIYNTDEDCLASK